MALVFPVLKIVAQNKKQQKTTQILFKIKISSTGHLHKYLILNVPQRYLSDAVMDEMI